MTGGSRLIYRYEFHTQNRYQKILHDGNPSPYEGLTFIKEERIGLYGNQSRGSEKRGVISGVHLEIANLSLLQSPHTSLFLFE